MATIHPLELSRPQAHSAPFPRRWYVGRVIVATTALLLLMTGGLAATASVGRVLRGMAPPIDPFADYLDIMPGQPWNAAIGSEFSCTSETVATRGGTYCTRALGDGPIALITITLRDGVIRWIDFTMAEGTLTVGDLAYSSGRPRVHLYGTAANFEWPDVGIKARGHAVTGRFSYFVPLRQVSLTVPDS